MGIKAECSVHLSIRFGTNHCCTRLPAAAGRPPRRPAGRPGRPFDTHTSSTHPVSVLTFVYIVPHTLVLIFAEMGSALSALSPLSPAPAGAQAPPPVDRPARQPFAVDYDSVGDDMIDIIAESMLNGPSSEEYAATFLLDCGCASVLCELPCRFVLSSLPHFQISNSHISRSNHACKRSRYWVYHGMGSSICNLADSVSASPSRVLSVSPICPSLWYNAITALVSSPRCTSRHHHSPWAPSRVVFE